MCLLGRSIHCPIPLNKIKTLGPAICNYPMEKCTLKTDLYESVNFIGGSIVIIISLISWIVILHALDAAEVNFEGCMNMYEGAEYNIEGDNYILINIGIFQNCIIGMATNGRGCGMHYGMLQRILCESLASGSRGFASGLGRTIAKP